MILFATVLPLKKGVSQEDVFDVISKWGQDENLKKDRCETKEFAALAMQRNEWSWVFVIDKCKEILHIYQETSCKTLYAKDFETSPPVIAQLIEKDLLDVPLVNEINKNLQLPVIILNRKRLQKKLACKLKGIAQVIYNPKSTSKFVVENVSMGVIPKKAVHMAFEYGRNYLYDSNIGWENLLSRKNLEETISLTEAELAEKDDALKESKEMSSLYEEEIQSLEKKVIEAENMLSASSMKISGLETKLSGEKPLLFYGDETDLYEGEVTDIILSVLSKEFKNLPEKSRRRDILESVLNQNKATGTGENIISCLKSNFRGYKNLSTSARSTLEALGFKINEQGSHYKITFKNDDRYLVVLSKTSSDKREGDNFVSNMVNAML